MATLPAAPARSTLLRVVIGLFLLTLFGALLAPSFAAATETTRSETETARTDSTTTEPGAPSSAPADDGLVRWSVSPANEDGRDDRRVINLDLEPGGEAEDRVLVHNLGSADVTFTLTANDGYRTKMGSFDMMPSDHTPEFGGAWITLAQDEVLVPAGAEAIVPFTVAVPENATPGDHIAGVAASIRTAGGSNVSTEMRVGVRVNIRVAGEVAATAALEVQDTRYVMSWNPFSPGRVELAGSVANDGNIRYAAALTGAAGGGSATGEELEFLPGETRGVSTTVEQVWPLGPIEVTYTVTPTVIPAPGGTGNDVAIAPVTYSVTVWAIPWPQLFVLLLLVGLVFLLLRARRAKARRLQALLDAARAEGAASASTGGSDSVRAAQAKAKVEGGSSDGAVL